MTDMQALADFWRARLDEREQIAKAAIVANDEGGGGPDWHAGEAGGVDGDYGPVYFRDGGIPTEAQDAHIAANDPATVLADIAADRALLAILEAQDGRELPEGVHDGRDPDEAERDEAVKDALEQVARIRVARFASHPEYRSQWAP